MVAARMQLDLHEVIAIARGQQAVAQACQLRPRAVGTLRYVALILLLITHEVVLQRVGLLRRAGGDDGPVALPHLATAEELVHTAQSLARLGKDHEASDGSVEAMDDAEEDIAGLLILLLEVALEGFAQRFIARLISLDDLARALAHHQQVVIFVDQDRGVWMSHRSGVICLDYVGRAW